MLLWMPSTKQSPSSKHLRRSEVVDLLHSSPISALLAIAMACDRTLAHWKPSILHTPPARQYEEKKRIPKPPTENSNTAERRIAKSQLTQPDKRFTGLYDHLLYLSGSHLRQRHFPSSFPPSVTSFFSGCLEIPASIAIPPFSRFDGFLFLVPTYL
ncbi:hypothetical protein B0H65DRAFT_465469 [Neurospora tetraspora]|uniref:Uncharacterized protein n=1 Tax=Neurospora tetraspora TaxID=94610 RepID=A0AAE0MRL5_9PEZI|nr:hypothetical protein B0H65DRAFT_465469 [Neurospora tetraspora]